MKIVATGGLNKCAKFGPARCNPLGAMGPRSWQFRAISLFSHNFGAN